MSNPVYFGKPFIIFILVMTLLSFFGGYQISQLIYRMNDYYQQRTEKILAMEGSIDDATIALGRQIQEWKDMLLRANDMEVYNKHKQAFFKYSGDVQQALMQAIAAMQKERMNTVEIDQLLIDHQTLLSDYLMAKSMLNPRQIDSFREVDKQVVGVDRNLQKSLAAVKAEIQQFANQRLNETMPAQGNRYLLGLLGACSLLIMALVGFAFARRS
jgi:methyl-accepting chemotaxis protein